MSRALTVQEEEGLIRAVRDRKNGAAEMMLHAYYPLLCQTARRIAGYQMQMWKDDLIQAGIIGMLRAADGYSADRGVRFLTYAVPWILGEMKRTMRAEIYHAGRYESRQKLLSAKDLLYRELGRMPTPQELSEYTGINPYEITLLMECSVSNVGFDEYSVCCMQTSANENNTALESITLRAALESLDEKDRQLIRLRYFQDRTQCETASLLGKTQSAVSKAERRILLHLRSLLGQK